MVSCGYLLILLICSIYGEEIKRCWGYEKDCPFEKSYSAKHLKCQTNNPKYIEDFFKQGDFGYIKPRIDSLKTLCDSGNDVEGSYLECSDHLRFCKARNIFFNLKNLNVKNSKRYRNDVIEKSQVGGNCKINFDNAELTLRADEKSYLQSWGHELTHFESYDQFKVSNEQCDYVFEKPTIVIKLDASVNLYHHFCDFLNLYASQHINGTFDRDIDILWWDTDSKGYADKYFGKVWEAFSNNKPRELIQFAGKKICFKNAMFPLLARQMYGLYYNTPLIKGCTGTGLFHSFSRHLIDHLHIHQEETVREKVRLTFLTRSSEFRQIDNIKELEKMLKEDFAENIETQVVDFDSKIPFLEQMRIIHNTDIFVSMHGSGLTHLLFLPDWAVVFEIYNCQDVNCYKDLARLRGVKYYTWSADENGITPTLEAIHPTLNQKHKKFANYKFDVKRFKMSIMIINQYVLRHPAYIDHKKTFNRKYGNKSESKSEL